MLKFLERKSRYEDLKRVKVFLKAHLEQLTNSKEEIPQDVFDVTQFFFDEVLDIYESMRILIRKEHFYACIPMARVLLENAINIQYIYKTDSEQRAKNFKLASTEVFLKRVLATLGKETPGYEEMKASLEQELKDYRQDKKTMEEKAREINLDMIYQDLYRHLSEYIHSSYKPRRVAEGTRPYSVYLRKVVFSDVLLVVLGALKSICEKYDLDGGVMIVDDPLRDDVILFSTNPRKHETVDRT